MNTEFPTSGVTVDGTGLLCVTPLLRLRKEIDTAAPGTIVHVIATDPAAPLDLRAWCHMTGHHYLGPVPEPGRDVYALRLTPQPMATRPRAPWRRLGVSGGVLGGRRGSVVSGRLRSGAGRRGVRPDWCRRG
ncbi:sulfurtransferase TusA family protein [Streptomyces rubrogriseus]|uniref:sulfurtransferase TusA family protein n=1 Tax=Streptomyces rubrogriseus TaxID=194673 RepID=UPI001FD1855E|nr:sulfurtransferase TusA family protein [Streptomyces rubrogriseus]